PAGRGLTSGPPLRNGVIFPPPHPRAPAMIHRLSASVLALVCLGRAAPGEGPDTRGWPGPREMAGALEDVWGEAALKLPGGARCAARRAAPPRPLGPPRAGAGPSGPAGPPGGGGGRGGGPSRGGGAPPGANTPPMGKGAGRPVSFHVGTPPRPFGGDPSRL